MKFGKVDDPHIINFKLPADDVATIQVLEAAKSKKFETKIGCAKWNKTELKGFYPKGTKDELMYYAQQFNCIELNATFYNMPPAAQVVKWKDKTPEGFKFFPKITNSISHYKRLLHVKELTEEYCNTIANFEEKLGMVFLQLHDNFSPNEFEKLEKFVKEFPKGIPLGVEVRNENWFADKNIFDAYATLLQKHKVTNIIVDTPGRRDMLHMRLTTPTAFVRWVGCNNQQIDDKRLNDWVTRIEKWHTQGLRQLYFFVHQNIEISSTVFAAYFIKQLNKKLKLDIKIPKMAEEQGSLF